MIEVPLYVVGPPWPPCILSRGEAFTDANMATGGMHSTPRTLARSHQTLERGHTHSTPAKLCLNLNILPLVRRAIVS